MKKRNKAQYPLLWGGNFTRLPSQAMLDFCSGWDAQGKLGFDEQLIPYDIKVNKAHAQMLGRSGIISKRLANKACDALKEMEALHKQGKLSFDANCEDVHTFVESYITSKYGSDVGGILHTARSRNDQIATDMRLYLKEHNQKYRDALTELASVLQSLGKKYAHVSLPGFSHHRPAMTTTFGVVFGSFEKSFKRDAERFGEWNPLYDCSPLGSVAGYGTSFPIDRAYTAKTLGFAKVEENTLDPITNRGEAETAFVFAVCCMMKHVSQLAQTVIMWSMPQFGYITIPDEFCTGSSIMPHKKNPDALEVMKAKACMCYGALQTLLTINTGNLIGYNRDTQWTKYAVMDVVAETFPVAPILSQLLLALVIHKKVLQKERKKYNVWVTTAMEQKIQKSQKSFRVVKKEIEKTLKVNS